MPDMLVKLYDLEDDWGFMAAQKEQGITIRKPIGPEKHLIVQWVSDNFGSAWAAEADAALTNVPRTCFVAVKAADIIGFACYDATALGFFGPIGIDRLHQGKATGKALLKACLLDMKLKATDMPLSERSKTPTFLRRPSVLSKFPNPPRAFTAPG